MLNKEDKNKMIDTLSSLISDGNSIKARIETMPLKINLGKFNLNDSPNNIWFNIITHLENTSNNGKSQIVLFLENMISEFEVDSLKYIMYELKDGINDKAKILANRLESGDLILVMGQDFLEVNHEGLLSLISKELKEELDTHRVYYDLKYSHIFYYLSQKLIAGTRNRITKTDLIKTSKGIVEYNYVNVTNRLSYDLISKLPFKGIINLNYDNYLERFHPDKYSTIITTLDTVDDDLNQILELSKSKIKIFNLFGGFFDDSKRERYSIVTESDLVNFFSKAIANELYYFKELKRTIIDKHNYYLFLGFDFNEWYVKILFKILLKIEPGDNMHFAIHRNPQKITSINKEFFEDDYKVTFIEKEDEVKFLQLLVEKHRYL